MGRIDGLGASWVRFDLNWSQVEFQDGVFDWSVPDAMFDAADARGLKVLPMLAYGPSFHLIFDPEPGEPTVDPAAYARFAGLAAERYSTRTDAFEIWNEPNLDTFWDAAPDPIAYGVLLDAAYVAIKDAAPNITVVAGGLAPAPNSSGTVAPLTFIEELYAGGFGDSFDALASHPYTYPVRPTTAEPTNPYYNLPQIRDLMIDNGDADKQIWLTEFGAATGSHPRAVSQAEQRDGMIEAIECAVTTPWIGPIFVYSHRDIPGGSADDLEANFGVLNEDGSSKLAGTAMRAINAESISEQPSCQLAP